MESNIRIRPTADDIRRRFAKTRLPDDASELFLPPGSVNWPKQMFDLLRGPLKPAGVLVALIERDELMLLLTQRSAHLSHHAAQVSFPGGRVESQDDDVAATALRETHEEVGIAPGDVRIAGYLQTMPTITGYAVTPVVGLVRGDVNIVPDHSEVEYTFEVPLSFLLNSANDVPVERDVYGKKVPMTEFHWQGERIWGATAYMIEALRDFIVKQ